MQHRDDMHISEEELLLAVDGELEGARLEAVTLHLSHCWTCRTRKAKLEATIQEFVSDCYSKLDSRIPPADNAAALLRARLSDLSLQKDPAAIRPHRLAWAAAALVVVTASAFFALMPFRAEPALAPNAALTPGATRPMSREAVCAATERSGPPRISNAVAREVFERYAIRDPRPRSYEVDYLIPPSLGGSEDPRNLWPQPYTRGVWSAHIKDALEDRLHSMVCDGSLDLATAQRDLATDWIAAYKKYFQTDKPRLDHVAFVKDSPWE